MLNGERRILQVSYVRETGSYEILSAVQGLDENGLAGKELTLLRPGDEITTLHYVSPLSGDDDELYYMKTDTLTVTENTAFTAEALRDGIYGFSFQMMDARGDSVVSKSAYFSVEDGEIYSDVG